MNLGAQCGFPDKPCCYFYLSLPTLQSQEGLSTKVSHAINWLTERLKLLLLLKPLFESFGVAYQ